MQPRVRDARGRFGRRRGRGERVAEQLRRRRHDERREDVGLRCVLPGKGAEGQGEGEAGHFVVGERSGRWTDRWLDENDVRFRKGIFWHRKLIENAMDDQFATDGSGLMAFEALVVLDPDSVVSRNHFQSQRIQSELQLKTSQWSIGARSVLPRGRDGVE